MPVPPGRKDPESERLANGQRQPGNWSHRHKTSDFKKQGRAVLLGSVNLLLSGRRPFPIKSLALSACVSPQIIHFWVLDKSPLLGLEGVPRPSTKAYAFLETHLLNKVSSTKLEDSSNFFPSYPTKDAAFRFFSYAPPFSKCFPVLQMRKWKPRWNSKGTEVWTQRIWVQVHCYLTLLCLLLYTHPRYASLWHAALKIIIKNNV